MRAAASYAASRRAHARSACAHSGSPLTAMRKQSGPAHRAVCLRDHKAPGTQARRGRDYAASAAAGAGASRAGEGAPYKPPNPREGEREGEDALLVG